MQILATYHGPAGVMSSTVTSVDDAALAAPIVAALNRVSACATVPISVWDRRGRRVGRYPTEHLAALTDRTAQHGLIEGTHSLWYELAMMLLHCALADLDTAVAAVPAPVRTAISAELDAEARGLRDELAEYTEGVEPPEPEKRRVWSFESPFVVFDESVSGLDQQDRDNLNDLEQGLAQAQLEHAVADLRLLLDAYLCCTNGGARFSSMVSRSAMIRTTKTRSGIFSTSRRRCRTASGGGLTGTSRYADGFRTVRKPRTSAATRASQYSNVLGLSRQPSRRPSDC